MNIAHEKLDGLDRDRVISAVEPVLRAHRVDGVELMWRTDSRGWVLYLTVEQPGSKEPGAGVTLDLCSDISRDLSAALDVEDVVPVKYRLEVGSPGLERSLYNADDYRRFSGHEASVRFVEPGGRVKTVQGNLRGVREDDHVVIEAPGHVYEILLSDIRSGRLVFDWGAQSAPASRPRPNRRRSRARRAARPNR